MVLVQNKKLTTEKLKEVEDGKKRKEKGGGAKEERRGDGRGKEMSVKNTLMRKSFICPGKFEDHNRLLGEPRERTQIGLRQPEIQGSGLLVTQAVRSGLGTE